jgi:hypothetical protein
VSDMSQMVSPALPCGHDRRSSGYGLPEEGGDPASSAPELGGEAALALLGLLQRRRVVLGVDFNGIAEAVSAHQVQSIIHFLDPPAREKGDEEHSRGRKASPRKPGS